MPKLIFREGIPRFRKCFKKTASGLKISKIDRKNNIKIADLLIRKNGTKRFTKYEHGRASYRVEIKPNQRDYYIAQKGQNGTTKYTKTKEMNMLNTFIEWYIRLFDQTGNETQQIIKFKGLSKPACIDTPPRKISH